MGRPPKWKDIPADQVESLAQIGCTIREMAAFFGVHPETISNHFSAEITKGEASRKIKLRKLQFRAAEAGNVAMLIFLGKNMLGQSDSVTYKTEEVPKTTVNIRRTDPALVNGNGHGNGSGG